MGKLTTIDRIKADYKRNGSLPSVGWVKITPTDARRILEATSEDTNFRKRSNVTTERYSLDLEGGLWELNGESIKFNPKGELIDGQHRLAACIVSKKPLTTVVAYGVKDDDNIDTGYKRNLSLLFRREGIVHYMEMATTIKWVYAIRNDVKVARRTLYSNKVALRAFQQEKNLPKYYPLVWYKSRLREAGIKMPCGGFLATLYLAAGNRAPLKIHEDFLDCMVSGEKLAGDALVFRNEMMRSDRYAHSSDVIQYEKTVGFIKAWNAWILKKKTGDKRKLFTTENGVVYPRIEPVPQKYRNNPLKSIYTGGDIGAKVTPERGAPKPANAKPKRKRKVARKK